MQKLTWFKATIFSGRIDCVFLTIIRFKQFIWLPKCSWKKKTESKKKMEMHRQMMTLYQVSVINSKHCKMHWMTYPKFLVIAIRRGYLMLRHFVVVSQILNLERDFFLTLSLNLRGPYYIHVTYLYRVTCYTEKYYYKLKQPSNLCSYIT